MFEKLLEKLKFVLRKQKKRKEKKKGNLLSIFFAQLVLLYSNTLMTENKFPWKKKNHTVKLIPM